MLPAWVILASILYAAILFAIAWLGDRYPLYPQRPWLRPLVYSLALAVYCSSWTFYGAVGSAVRYGIGFLPIYLGPLLMFIVGWRILDRLATISQNQNTVSIADFMASRYGRSQRLAAWVAMIAVLAAVPYLALQYKAVALSLRVLAGTSIHTTLLGDPALYVAVGMALFAILFGTRQVDATEHRPGLMLAVAFESIVKLLALVAVGLFAVFWFQDQPINMTGAVHTLFMNATPVGFVGQTLLAFTAIICLPRQFHVAVVECGDTHDVRRARWWFGGYLVIVSVMVLPIAAAGVALFGADVGIEADTLVLALPLAENQLGLALMVYIGGFSAATGMVIVTSVALSTMVSNDLVMPLLLRRHGGVQPDKASLASTVLWVRRLAIMAVAGAAYLYYAMSGTDTALAAYGLMAFVAVAQFAPGLIGGLYWRGASRQGVELGLLLGFGLWAYTLFLPTLTEAGLINNAWLSSGPWGISWLRPYQLFGLALGDPLTHGTFWSLLANMIAFFWVSIYQRPGLGERLRAEAFLNPYDQYRLPSADLYGDLRIQDLLVVAGSIVGEKTAQRAFAEQAQQMNQDLDLHARADSVWVHFTELLLAAAVGAASARLVITSALRGSGLEVAAIVAVLDEAGQALRFNRDILLATLENIDHGVSVVDADMRLVAWNQSYQQLFAYPPGMLYVGRPVADLLRYNAELGRIKDLDPHAIQDAVERRIQFMREGSSYVTQRVLNDQHVLELRGRPLPGGGYVTSYSDVTEFKRVEKELRNINETLEQRVAERTQEAERAQETRSQFLTAVSHDVLQPINAARLFASALRESSSPVEMPRLAERVDTALRNAEELLEGLLDISRLNAGAMHPELETIDVQPFLQHLADQYAPMATQRGLRLKVYAPALYVRSDPRLLRRVLQNFLANALRYTRSGRIVLAARKRGTEVEFQVWDTGQGIPEHHVAQIYTEFHRYEQPFDWDGKGLGLGLSICQRIALLLEHRLDARSTLGRGSMFAIWAPLAEAPLAMTSVDRLDAPIPGLRLQLQGSVLCLDNDPDILAGMEALLNRWGIACLLATHVDEALVLMAQQPQVLLVDYHLHDRLNGLDALEALRKLGPDTPGALLTADGSDELKAAAKARGYRVLSKPVRPASLRAFLTAHLPQP